MTLRSTPAKFWIVTAAVLLLSRLAHRTILWADEDYHLAAAIQILRGKMLYRDVWYDKPPLTALLDVLFGAWYGWPLRIACTLAALGVCWIGFKLAEKLWGPREGFAGAAWLAFFQIFYLPAAVMPLEPDTLLLLPELAAVYFAVSGRSFTAGLTAGAGLLLSPKGVFVLAPCFLFLGPGQWIVLLAGFALPNAAAVLGLWAAGALPGFWQQVWQWGWLYVTHPGSDPQAQRGFAAVLDWFGFHLALLLAGIAYVRRERNPLRWRMLAWIAIAFVAAALGGRFAPRYFNLLMAAMTIPAARAVAAGWRQQWLALVALALIIPVFRFGPRYATLAWEDLTGAPHDWADIALDLESRGAASVVSQMAKPGDTIFVWGYRPDLIVYTRLAVASKFWDSQPVTGVPADRHLSDARSIAPEWAAENSVALARSTPTFIVDGLSAYNPQLGISNYGEVLRPWASSYCPAAQGGGVSIYRVCRTPDR
jgi:hypothetical protein